MELITQQNSAWEFLSCLSRRSPNFPEMFFLIKKGAGVEEDLSWLAADYRVLHNGKLHPVNGKLEKIKAFNCEQSIKHDCDLLFIYIRALLPIMRIKEVNSKLSLCYPRAEHLFDISQQPYLRPLSCLENFQMATPKMLTFFPLNSRETANNEPGKLSLVCLNLNNFGSFINLWLAYLAPTWLEEILNFFPNLQPKLPVS